MKKHLVSTVLHSSTVAGAGRVFAEGRPNIVVMLADDMGFGEVQCLNPTRGKIKTPQLDAVAAGGMTFTDAHSGSSVCGDPRPTSGTADIGEQENLARARPDRAKALRVLLDEQIAAGRNTPGSPQANDTQVIVDKEPAEDQ